MNAIKHCPHGWWKLFVIFWSLAGIAPLANAQATRPLDLKPFFGKSQFQNIGAEWILPRGRQVVEGVPFQIDGILELAGSSARFSNVGRSNISDIPVTGTFERVYLLAAASRDVKEGVAVAHLAIRYTDGSQVELPIEYGRHLSDWMGPRHKGEAPLIEPDARVAWQVEHTAASRRDDSLRLFYLSLANPNPTKPMQSISVQSTLARGGLMVAAITMGPERVERQPDTLAKVEEHFHLEGADKPALTGRVVDEQGKPVVDAVIRVVSVKTIDTTDQLTPDDNQFVGRETKTASDGRYRLEQLSERLLYRLMVAAPKRQPSLFDAADPLAGLTNVRLVEGSGGAEGQFMVQARIVGPDDKPVVGASVKPDGVGIGGSTSWGGNNGFPNEVFTGLNGEFIMAREERFTRMSVNIKAPELAPSKIWLPASNGVQTVKLGIGSRLTGRVSKDGQPMAGVEVGVSGVNRSSEVFAGHYEVKTDADGQFAFEHLPPNTEWYLYGLMRSLRRDGSIAPRPVRTGEHGETNNVGELKVEPAITLAGRIKTSDGQPLPSGLRMTVSLESAWDNQTPRVERDGTFVVTGLHTGQVDISVMAKDWTLSGENRSLDDWNPWRMTGVLRGDKRDLLLVIEKKERNNNNYSGNGSLPESDRAANRPLFGAEESGPPAIVFQGVAIDDATGQPVASVRITPGRKPPSATPVAGNGLLQTLVDAMRPRTIPWNERPYWERGRAQTFAGGRFTISARPLTSLPMLRLESEGYEVLDTEPTSKSQTNLTLRLKKGTGPAGTLLTPDGRPAAGVSVVYASENEQFSLGETGALSTYGENRALVTKADGSFAFPSRAGGRRFFAASDAGWANVSTRNWPADGRIRLEPWAKLSGALVGPDGKPATVQVALELHRNYEEGDPWVNFQERPNTGNDGKFSFQRVPPGELRLVHLVPMSRGGWMHAFQTNFVAQPGKSVDLGSMPLSPSPPGGF